MATAFIPNPENKPLINHLDCNRQNNCVDNLEWCTPKENSQYASKLGRMKWSEKRKENKKKLIIATNVQTNEEIHFKSQAEAAKFLNINVSSIRSVLKDKCKQTKGYTFRYKDPN